MTIDEQFDDLRKHMAAMEERIVTAIAACEARSQEFARDIETNLLAAFHGHAKGQTARLHTTEVVTHDLGVRVAALEDRMLNLETRR